MIRRSNKDSKIVFFLSKFDHQLAGISLGKHRAVVMVLKLDGQAVPSKNYWVGKHTICPKFVLFL